MKTTDEHEHHPLNKQVSWLHGMVTRRSMLASTGLAGIGALGAGTFAGRTLLPERVASTTATPPPAAVTPSAGQPTGSAALPDRTFVSTKLTTPHVTSWGAGQTAPGLVFATPQGHGSAAVILDSGSRPVWMEPSGAGAMDLRVQTFEGKQVLTYWQGTSEGGHGAGKGVILDSAYRTVASVSAGNGLSIDLHEFRLTDAGTALILAYPTAQADLTAVGGPAKGYLLDCHVQEVDVRSGAVLLDWKASEHIGLTETYATAGGKLSKDGTTEANAFDAYHLNSVDDDGDALLISSRHTHTLYQIDRKSGDVRWRMGGKKSDFTVADNAAFAWQHDARRRSATLISLFDNHFAEETTGTSRGLLLNVDEAAKTVTLKQEFANAGHGGNAEGNIQLLPNGNVMVGWGADPSATEFSADGTAVFEAAGLGNGCYRVYRFPWTAQPDTPPSMAIKNGAGQSMQVFASWNGATEVKSWRVLTGPDSNSLKAAGTGPRSGFETMVAVASAKFAAVQALAADGSVLGTSGVTPSS